MANICLSMIIKEMDAGMVRKCLLSVLPHVSSFAIHDTGSSPDVLAVIDDLTAGLPGVLEKCQFVDYASSRNAVLCDARQMCPDYILSIDADETLEVGDHDALNGLTEKGYHIMVSHGNTTFRRLCLIDADPGWAWVGDTHEVLKHPLVKGSPTLDGVTVLSGEGISTRNTSGRVYADDAERIKHSLQREMPDGDRWQLTYSLAQSYFHAGGMFQVQGLLGEAEDYIKKAIETFRAYLELPDPFVEKRAYAMLSIARAEAIIGIDQNATVKDYLTAHRIGGRPEAIGSLVSYLRTHGRFEEAIFYAKQSLTKDFRRASFISEPEWANWHILVDLAVSLAAVGEIDSALLMLEEKLHAGGALDEGRLAIESAIDFIKKTSDHSCG